MSESKIIQFIVPAVPVAQPRARATTVNGMARMYEAKKSHPVHDFKASVRLSASQAYQGPPLDYPLNLWLAFVFPSKLKSRVWKPTKPDIDNLVKSFCDALNSLLWIDDGQIVQLIVTKEHASSDEQPHVLAVVQPAADTNAKAIA